MKVYKGQSTNNDCSSLRQSRKSMDITMVLVGSSYWLLFAFSSGMIEYYRYSLADVLSKTIANKPVFLYYHNLSYFLMYGGIYWFPTNHIGIALPLMQFTLSVFLSIMVSLVVGDTIKIKRGKIKKRNGISLGGSLLSMISTTGSCCSLPFVYYFLTLVTTSSTSFGVTLFFSSYSYLIDSFIILILVFFHLRNRKFNEQQSQDSTTGLRSTV